MGQFFCGWHRSKSFKMKYLLGFAILCFCMHVQAEKDGKFLSMFNIVRFSNYACDAGGNKNGTCYTKDECDQRGGINEGACAEGYGVCCTFTARCGDVSSENNTYFESDGDEKGHCTLRICKAKESIVQLRLDFETFNIAAPSDTDIQVQTVSNNVVADGSAGTLSNLATACLDDAFTVSNPGGQSPPVICGNNNGINRTKYGSLCKWKFLWSRHGIHWFSCRRRGGICKQCGLFYKCTLQIDFCFGFL